MASASFSQVVFLWVSVVVYAGLGLLGVHWSILSTVVNTLAVKSLYSLIGMVQVEVNLMFQVSGLLGVAAICAAMVISSAQIIMAYTILAEALLVIRALEALPVGLISWLVAMLHPQIAVIPVAIVTYEHLLACKVMPSLAGGVVSVPQIFQSWSDFHTAKSGAD
ncbi:hypothetical protein [Candidatus Synchoanobacter obligatus]|uniref:Uncharacterized protein n=1 Tax=Candidatus Synchoanobacter obligatus TaxID=2919597 RepID=A0ABT1L523_9GAMM|nr:hypothetical protein [Candidatus Synchoanobacter obligatus]MCP8352277.1 hypothetical protein [Candidatus Synchoanobacter obligatus]